jgi:hypothetical protein
MERIALHEEVLKALDQAIDTGRYTYQEISDGSGVPKRTVEKIKRREIVDPGVSHCESLANFFREQAAEQREAQP